MKDRVQWNQLAPLALGTMIVASFSFTVGNIEHSIGLVARSVIADRKIILMNMQNQGHSVFTSISKAVRMGKRLTDFHRVDYLTDLIFESFLCERRLWTDAIFFLKMFF